MSGGKLEFRLFVSFYVPLTSIDHPMTQPDLFVMLNWFTNTIITGGAGPQMPTTKNIEREGYM